MKRKTAKIGAHDTNDENIDQLMNELESQVQADFRN